MAKIKVSATIEPEYLSRARELTGCSNVSELLDRGLRALIEVELERRHADGYARRPQGAETVRTIDTATWAEIPWDEE